MTDWRFWITYTGKVRVESDDKNVALLAAAELHAERLNDGSMVYLPEVEVEPIIREVTRDE